MTPIGKAIEALESACGNRCNAEYNPCEYREAIAALQAQPTPPPECQTEGEKTAYAFGWWKGIESVRLAQPDHSGLVKREDCAKLCESIKTVGDYDDVERGFNAALSRAAKAIRNMAANALEGKI